MIPYHKNVIRNFINVEVFHKADSKKEDCLGWITIMELADENLRTLLKEERIDLRQRKTIANGILDGFFDLFDCGIGHFDRKMENILLIDGVPKIIDFGLVYEETGRNGYREMGYTRRGSKYKNSNSLGKSSKNASIKIIFSCWLAGIH